MTVFDKRTSFKPFEYPEAAKFKDAIRHSYWLHTEWNFTSDVSDYHQKLTDAEKGVIKRALLAISQIEVSVKKFWGKLGDHFPKAEFDAVGATFADSEVRHADAYSHLLEVLGFNDEFESLKDEPTIQGRVDYLTKFIAPPKNKDRIERQDFAITLALFSLFVENVSLFSQFAIIKSFNKYKNLLKDIDNVVQATQKEETIHAQFGVYMIRLIKKEFPEYFTEQFSQRLRYACEKAFHAESEILDWIFQDGEPDFLKKETVKAFLAHRFNESLAMLDEPPLWHVDQEELKKLSWFDDEIHGNAHLDFFHKKPVTYSKKLQPITAKDLF